MIGKTISHYRITARLGEARDQHACGEKSHGVSYGQETKTPHPIRIAVIIVDWLFWQRGLMMRNMLVMVLAVAVLARLRPVAGAIREAAGGVCGRHAANQHCDRGSVLMLN